MNKKLVYRVLIYLIGLFLIASGVAFAVNSNLGVSPVNSFPFVLSVVTNSTLGLWATIVFSCYVLIQIIILRRDFKLKNLLQVVFSTIFGYFVNFTRWLLGDFVIPTYAGRLAMLAISIVLIALGLVFYLTADIVPMPMEGLGLAIAAKLKTVPFHRVKIALDCMSVALAVIVSLVFLQTLVGVREGTVISAIVIGKVMAIFAKPIKPWLQKLCFNMPADAQELKAVDALEAEMEKE